ncbi:MAG TPA: polyphosphate polymerase domain-containing protein [Pseudomonadota bacterium]|nr:polyphosphate polymerase domain-containing protein [Pseudomonadota bacterium]
MNSVPISFERFEYKYWLNLAQEEALLQCLATFMRRDAMAPGGQQNTSLYLDSEELDFFTLHVDKTPDRPKLRVRAYGNPPSGKAFFEIKRKIKRVCFKDRATVPMNMVPKLLRGEIPAEFVLRPEERKILDHFLYLMYVWNATPKLLITCKREAFTSILPDEGVRLTLDRQICYQPMYEPTLLGDPKAWISLCGQMHYQPEAPTLCEIKFRNMAPVWIADMVQGLKLRLAASSKYVMAMRLDSTGGDSPEMTDPFVPPSLKRTTA